MASFENSLKYDLGGADATERVPPGVAVLGGSRSVVTASAGAGRRPYRCNDFKEMSGGTR